MKCDKCGEEMEFHCHQEEFIPYSNIKGKGLEIDISFDIFTCGGCNNISIKNRSIDFKIIDR
mgnify:CR=1 FL=1